MHSAVDLLGQVAVEGHAHQGGGQAGEVLRGHQPGQFAAGRRGVAARMTKRQHFQRGDKVEWDSHGGTAVGEVVEKITTDTEAAGRTVRASEDEPQYRVRSEKSGGDAVHKPEALRRRS